MLFSLPIYSVNRLINALPLSTPRILRRFLLSKMEHVYNLCQSSLQTTNQTYTCRVHSLMNFSSRFLLPLLQLLGSFSQAVPSNSELARKSFASPSMVSITCSIRLSFRCLIKKS